MMKLSFLWEIIFRYTVIDHNDGFKDQSVVIVFPQRRRKCTKITLYNMIEAKIDCRKGAGAAAGDSCNANQSKLTKQ
jgi:hypothetical protein